MDLLSPVADDIDLTEIAGALSRQCRYNGNITRFYSVAEHSVLIAGALRRDGHPREVVLAGLIHDAAEAYTGDITWPVQQVLWGAAPEAREAYKAMQHRIDVLICDRVGIDPDLLHCDVVKEADLRILLDERDALLTGRPRPWGVEEMGMQPLGVRIACDAPSTAATFFRMALGQLGVSL